MKNVVKYDVYLDILLLGPIYVTTSLFKENPKSIILQTLSSRLRHRYGVGHEL